MALGLLSQGTVGTSFDELRTGLHLTNMDKKSIADQFHQYYRLLNRSVGQSELMFANQIYVKQGYELKTYFRDVASMNFFSGVEAVNFVDAESTARTINNFVKIKTKDKIREVVNPDMFSLDSLVVSVNAIYLKSEWVHHFRSTPGPWWFYINETEKVVPAYMKVETDFRLAELDDLDAVALRMDYRNSNLSFVIVLPNKRTGLQALEPQLADYDLSRMLDKMDYRGCRVTIPKFKIESEFDMKDVLTKVSSQKP